MSAALTAPSRVGRRATCSIRARTVTPGSRHWPRARPAAAAAESCGKVWRCAWRACEEKMAASWDWAARRSCVRRVLCIVYVWLVRWAVGSLSNKGGEEVVDTTPKCTRIHTHLVLLQGLAQLLPGRVPLGRAPLGGMPHGRLVAQQAQVHPQPLCTHVWRRGRGVPTKMSDVCGNGDAATCVPCALLTLRSSAGVSSASARKSPVARLLGGGCMWLLD